MDSEEKKELKLFTIDEIVYLILLSRQNFKKIKLLNYTKLAKLIGLGSSDSRFIKIKNYLIEENILEEVEKSGGSTIIEINDKKLMEEIPEIPFMKFVHQKFIKEVWGKTVWVYDSKRGLNNN